MSCVWIDVETFQRKFLDLSGDLKVQLTTIEVGPGFVSSHPAHHHWSLDWKLSSLHLLSVLLSGRPARWNPKWFGSKVIILLLSLRRLLPWNGPKWSAPSKFEEGTWVSLVRPLPNATGQTGKTEPGDLLHLRQGLLLDHSGMEGVSSRIIFESSGRVKQE